MPCNIAKTRIVKKLGPDQPGAKKLTRRYGESLVCVRYRQDNEAGLRYTTVEILVDQDLTQQARDEQTTVLVRISHVNTATRTKARSMGAEWDTNHQAWRMSLHTAKRLKLSKAILEKLPPLETRNGTS